MAYSITKPLTLAVFMALGLAGCNNSSETASDAPVDDATAAPSTTGTLEKIKDSGTIVVKTPSAPNDITCNVIFKGNVAAGVATITSATLSGPVLCTVPTLKNIPSPGWGLTATSFDTTTQKGTGVVTGVGWTIVFPVSNCGPGPLNVVWDEPTQTLSTTGSQSLSGNCFVRSLNVKAPTLHLQ